jgi:hypothetical protein
MKPSTHIAASAAISTSLLYTTKSELIAGASFFCGFLIDFDHVLDYIREYGFRNNAKDFFRIFHETRFNKLFLIFHAWELVIGLFLLAALSGYNELIIGISIGMFHHLLLDQIANGVTPWGYFIIYRAVKKFSTNDIVRDDVVQRKRMQVHK